MAEVGPAKKIPPLIQPRLEVASKHRRSFPRHGVGEVIRRERRTGGSGRGADTPVHVVGTQGVANRTSEEPMTPEVHHRIGSVTKTFTISLLLQAEAKGLLSLNDTIKQYVEGVPNGDKITRWAQERACSHQNSRPSGWTRSSVTCHRSTSRR